MVSSPSETLAYRTPACPRVGLSLAPFLLLFFSFYSTLVSILVVAAVVIDDAGRHRAAGRVVIGKVARPYSSSARGAASMINDAGRPTAFVLRVRGRVVSDDAGHPAEPATGDQWLRPPGETAPKNFRCI